MSDETPTPEAASAEAPAAEASAADAHGASGHSDDHAKDAKKKGGAKGALKELLGTVTSKDGPARRMAIVFILSSLGTVWVAVLIVSQLMHRAQEASHAKAEHEAQEKKMHEITQKHAEEARERSAQISLGDFTLELRSQGGRHIAGLDVAEVSLVAECDSKEVCSYLESNIEKVRNEITNALTPIEREELLTTDGKRRVKNRIIDRLNIWLPHGKIQNIFLSKLIIS